MWAGASGVHAGTQAAPACTLSTPSQVSGGRGRGGPADAHVAIAGGGPEPQPPVGRKQAAAAAPQNRARGPRAPGSPAGVAAVAGWPLPPADGGRRDPGSERGEGRREPPGRWERAPSGASCVGGGEASERILVARFSGWWCLGTETPSAAAGFAEALARQVSTHTPSWFAANKARHRKRRSKCYSPCTGPRASHAEQPLLPARTTPVLPKRL